MRDARRRATVASARARAHELDQLDAAARQLGEGVRVPGSGSQKAEGIATELLFRDPREAEPAEDASE